MNRRHKGRATPARGAAMAFVALVSCLNRPVETSPPDEKTTFTTTVSNESIDQIDLLFMIDNSSSMGDKQALLAAAIPDMVTRLVTPNCVDKMGVAHGQSDASGNCPAGTTVEFPPVHDMHVGIVTSSIGALYPTNPPSVIANDMDQCSPSTMSPIGNLNAHDDDRGELINRGGDAEAPVPSAQPLNFLAWYPANQPPGTVPPATQPVPPETQVGATGQSGTLIGDFAAMVAGVHEHGCGFEAQNEAWYRFLVQPDPFDHLEVSPAGSITEVEVGIDAVILKQRAAFLRPNSLVAVIAVSDENEDHYDPLAIDGEGWLYEQSPFPGAPQSAGVQDGAPEGTVDCSDPVDTANPTTTGPYGPKCASCAFASVSQSPTFAQECPSDPPSGIDGYLDPNDDGINVRFFQPKRRFGVAPYFPISRYVRGLTSTTVPDRAHEHDASGNYVGDQDAQANCVNPLFAAALPTDPSQELCNLAIGPRPPANVYYAAITGVPHQLLQVDPTNADSPQKDTLSDADWLAITGRDPDHYDFTGADPHMLEAENPRPTGCPPGSNDKCDPINGREYATGKQDMQFACIFPFVDPATGQSSPKDCTLAKYSGACDCTNGNVHQDTPLCAKDANGNYTQTQVNGKAYPCLRELEVAHGMGAQGIVSSLCPIHPSPSPAGNMTDPLYGYRPAVNAIVDRLKIRLEVQCVPAVPVDATGRVPCLLLAVMNQNAGESETGVCDDATQGLSVPEQDVFTNFVAQQRQGWLNAGGTKSGLPDPATVPVCQLNQIKSSDPAYEACVSGANAMPPGWCYAQVPTPNCPQQILFTQGQPPKGALVRLQCLEQTNEPVDGGGT